MAPLHPELAQLKDRFESLLDDYDAGHIDYETAETTLKSLVVIDGTGAHWSLDEEGNFLRGMPGGPQHNADPVSFRPAQLPMRSEVPNMPQGATIPSQAAPWAPQAAPVGAPVDLHTPPSGFLAQSPGSFDPLAGPMGAGPHIPGYPAVEEDSPFPRGAKGPAKSRPGGAKKAPKAKGPKANLPKRPGAAGSLGGAKKQGTGNNLVHSLVDSVASIRPATFLQGRGKTILIGLACVLALFVGYSKYSSHNDSPAGGIPSASAAANMPSDSKIPNGDDSTRIVTALVSGNANVAGGFVKKPADSFEAVQSLAQLKGLTDLGYAVSAGPAAATDGGAAQDWSVSQGDKKLGTIKVQLVNDGGTWKLADWPALSK